VKFNSLVYTYAITKVLQDDNQYYLDTFSPFIVYYFNKNDNYKSLESIQIWILAEYNFKLPLYIIKTLLERLVSQNILFSKGDGKFAITELGRNYEFKFKKELLIEDFIDSLIRDINKYLNQEKNYHIYFTFNDLENYINEHIDRISYFLETRNQTIIANKQLLEKYLWEYISNLESRDKYYYHFFRDLVLGKFIQASFDYYPERDDKFKSIAYFLDTNLLFCALGLDFIEFQEPVEELLGIMRDRGLELMVLDITVSEAKRVLKNCIRGHDLYEKSVKVNSICAFLRNEKNMNNDKIRTLIKNFEDNIREKDIQILATGIDLRPHSFIQRDKKINGWNYQV